MRAPLLLADTKALGVSAELGRMSACQRQQFRQRDCRRGALVARGAAVDHELGPAQAAKPVGCKAKVLGKLARLDGGVRRQRIQRRQRAIRIAIDFREHRMHDRLPLLPPLRGELRKTCILRDAAGECRGRRDQIFSTQRNSGREGFGPFLVVGDTPFPLDRKAERNARPLPELGHLLPLLGNPGPTPQNLLFHSGRDQREMIKPAPSGEVAGLRLVTGLILKIERRCLGAGARQALDELLEQLRPMAFPLDPLPAGRGGFQLACAPDIAIDLPFLEALLTGLRIDNRNLDLDPLHAVFAQRDRVALRDASILKRLRQADAPEPMDGAVVGPDVGIGALVRILVIGPELCHPFFHQFAGDAGGMVDTRLTTPVRLRLEVLFRRVKIGAVAMAGHRHIGQMLVHHAGGKHEGAVDGRPLRFMNGRGIAVIDIAIAVLADDDVAATVEAHRQQRIAASVAGGNDRTEHAVLHVLRSKPPCPRLNEAGVFEEDDPVASGELAKPTRRLEFPRPCQRALADHDLAQGLVQLPDIVVGVGENQQLVAAKAARMFAVGGFLKQVTAGIGPIGNDAADDIVPRLRLDQPAMRGIGIETLFDLAAGKEARGIARPRITLAAHAGKFGKADPFGDRPERRTRLDRLQLHRVADQHGFRAGIFHRLQDTRHLLRRHHAGLVDHQHIATLEQIASAFPGQFPGSQRTRPDAGTVLQPLGRLASQGCADHPPAFTFPGDAGRRQQRRLAAPARPTTAAMALSRVT